MSGHARFADPDTPPPTLVSPGRTKIIYKRDVQEVCHYSDYSSHEGGILVTPQIRRMLEILGVPATPSGVKLCCDKRSLAYSCLQLLTAA